MQCLGSKHKLLRNIDADPHYDMRTAGIQLETIDNDVRSAMAAIERGSGGKPGSDALNTAQIQEIFKKYDHVVVPVVPCDGLVRLLPDVSPKTRQFYIVMNVAPSASDGTKDGHWTAWCLDNERKICYWYNSLAYPAKAEWLKDVKRLIMKMDPVHLWVYKYNTVRNQSFATSDCGYFASHFVHEMMAGSSFSKATFYEAHPREAERLIKPWIKKWRYL